MATALVADDNDVFLTTDAGATWTSITATCRPWTNDFHAIVYLSQPTSDMVFVGGLTGVSLMSMSKPGHVAEVRRRTATVPVWDLDINAADDILVAGTFGRGAWTVSRAEVGGGLDVSVLVAPDPLYEDPLDGRSPVR